MAEAPLLGEDGWTTDAIERQALKRQALKKVKKVPKALEAV